MSREPNDSAFDAFISYSGSTDAAKLIYSRLSRVGAPPWQFSKWWKLKVFFDKEKILIGDDLPESISSAVQHSKYFVLLASKAAARSEWVCKELEFWLKSKSALNILIVVLDGTIEWDHAQNDFNWDRTDCIPPILKGKCKEACWEDLRHLSPGALTKTSRAELGNAIASIGAKILDVPRETIISRERTQHRRFWSSIGLVVTGLILTIALLAMDFRDTMSKIPADNAYNEGKTILITRRNPGDIKAALNSFERALKLNPRHIPALLGKADAHILLIGFGGSANPDDDLEQASEALIRVKELSGDNTSDYHRIRGRLLLYKDTNVLGARASLAKAAAMDPYNVDVLYALASTYTFLGEHKEAEKLCEKALSIIRDHGDGDKDNKFIHAKCQLAWTCFYAGKYDRAIAECNEILSVDKTNDNANKYLAHIYAQKGDYKQSLDRYRKAGGDNIDADPNLFANFSCALALDGELPEALKNIDKLLSNTNYVSPYRLAQCYATMGDTENALKQLKQARASRDIFVVWSAVDPLLKKLRGNAEFQEYLKSVGLGEAKAS